MEMLSTNGRSIKEELELSNLSLVRARLPLELRQDFDDHIRVIYMFIKNGMCSEDISKYALSAQRLLEYSRQSGIFIDVPSDPYWKAIKSISKNDAYLEKLVANDESVGKNTEIRDPSLLRYISLKFADKSFNEHIKSIYNPPVPYEKSVESILKNYRTMKNW